MKFVVDEMPYYYGDCPFFYSGKCSLLNCRCDRFDVSYSEQNMDECDCLITFDAMKNKEI